MSSRAGPVFQPGAWKPCASRRTAWMAEMDVVEIETEVTVEGIPASRS